MFGTSVSYNPHLLSQKQNQTEPGTRVSGLTLYIDLTQYLFTRILFLVRNQTSNTDYESKIMIDINTPDGEFVLFIAEFFAAKLPHGTPSRNDFLSVLQDEPERIEGMILLQYDAILVLADNQKGIKPTFSKDEGLNEIMPFLPAFFAPELVAFA